MMSTRRGIRTAVLAVALALAGAGGAQAQEKGSPVAVTTAPVIVGEASIGATLFAAGGAWRTPNPDPDRTEAWWEWWRCPAADSYAGCEVRARAAAYAVAGDDAGAYLVLVRYVRWASKGNPKNAEYQQQSRASAPLAIAFPASTPPPSTEPAATPTPDAAPTPPPRFDTAAATPVPTSGEVLQETARTRRVIRPFPVVRMRGRLTATGADIQILSVRAPRAAKVSVRCSGRGCPASRWSRDARTSPLTRIGRFERGLRAGVTITVSVTRRGYVGKRTTFVIRRGSAPLRSDHCLSSKGRVTRCPSGIS
jgi:hypothetical protein